VKKIYSVFFMAAFLCTIINAFTVVKITVSSENSLYIDFLERAAENFNSTDEELKIDIITQELPQGDNCVDVILVEEFSFEKHMINKDIFPLDLYIRLDSFYLDDFFFEMLSHFSYGGKIYGLPTGFYSNPGRINVKAEHVEKNVLCAFAICNNSEFKEEAWTIIKYLTCEGQKILMENDFYFPSRKSLLDF